MSDFLLNSFNTLGHGLVGYIIPFLFVLTIVVFFHELGHFPVSYTHLTLPTNREV